MIANVLSPIRQKSNIIRLALLIWLCLMLRESYYIMHTISIKERYDQIYSQKLMIKLRAHKFNISGQLNFCDLVACIRPEIASDVFDDFINSVTCMLDAGAPQKLR